MPIESVEEYQASDGSETTSGLPLVGQLVTYAATGRPLERQNRRFAWRPEGNDDRQFQWALKGGLGPLLHRATGDFRDQVPQRWRDALLSADLRARITHGNAVDTMLEILDVCDRMQVRATLLKGISVSEQFYPAEHLRPMGDIDILIPAHAYARMEAALLESGYGQEEFPTSPGMHHGPPLHHATLGTEVELHTKLFPDSAPFGNSKVFGASNVAAQSIPSAYHGRAVNRLTPEFQLVYIASSWFNDMTHHKMQPSFIASLLDGAYLLGASGTTLNWDGIFDWLDNDLAKASVYTMITYLSRFGAKQVPPATLARLASSQKLVGSIQLRLIHATLDRYLIGGRPWNLPLPPPVPARYNVAYQFEKRVLRRLRAMAWTR